MAEPVMLELPALSLNLKPLRVAVRAGSLSPYVFELATALTNRVAFVAVVVSVTWGAAL